MIRVAIGIPILCFALTGLPGCGGAATPACDPGLVECWQECVDPLDDRAHCGGCGQVCDSGAYCAAGTCVDCRHACEAGQVRCFDSAQYQSCIAGTDTCREWAPPVACGLGYVCKYGACEPDCADTCPQAGQQQCSQDGTGLQICSDVDGDGCLEWEAPIDCGRCSLCIDGGCQATCADECPGLGERQCAGPASYQECGDFDADEGWEWGPVTDCDANQTCDAGVCQ